MSKAEARELFIERFVPKIEFTGYCWLWTAAKVGKPNNFYPGLQWKGKVRRAHRLSYLFFNGPIGRRCDVHHTCRNQLCVNPDHLELRTRLEHQKEHSPAFCVNGHERTPENRRPDGSCVTCNRLRSREYWRVKNGK